MPNSSVRLCLPLLPRPWARILLAAGGAGAVGHRVPVGREAGELRRLRPAPDEHAGSRVVIHGAGQGFRDRAQGDVGQAVFRDGPWVSPWRTGLAVCDTGRPSHFVAQGRLPIRSLSPNSPARIPNSRPRISHLQRGIGGAVVGLPAAGCLTSCSAHIHVFHTPI